MGKGKVIAYLPHQRKQNIDAPVEGRLGRWFIREGSEVKRGDPIVEIFDNDPDILNRIKSEKNSISTRLQAVKISLRNFKNNF